MSSLVHFLEYLFRDFFSVNDEKKTPICDIISSSLDFNPISLNDENKKRWIDTYIMEYLSQEILIEEVVRIRKRYLESGANYPRKLFRECKALEKKLVIKSYNDQQLISLKYKLIKLEKWFSEIPEKEEEKRFKGIAWVVSVIGIVLLYIKQNKSDPYFIEHPVLNNSYEFAYFVLIAFLGTMSYVFTKALTIKNEYDGLEIRFYLAFLFPVVFMNLFDYNGDNISGLSKLNVIMFAAGYSSEFIFALFTKIVDLAKKVINEDNKEEVKQIKNRIEKLESPSNNTAEL